jgi:hypothetical protein
MKKQKSKWSAPSILPMKKPAAKKPITPIAPIPPISTRHDVGTSFGDAEFFRSCVIERARSTPLKTDAPMSEAKIAIWDACFQLNTVGRAPGRHIANTELLIKIAALCERAAVDLTIPASRIQRQDAKPPRRKKGARP